MNNEAYVLRMLGLAMRGGRLVSGEFACEEALRTQKAAAVFVSGDASANTVNKFRSKSEYYQVPFFQMQTGKDELGAAIGKGARSSVALTDEGIARTIIEKSN